ncbi:MAG TPA: ArsA-related P-loop ATPase, partial [Enhygromyxa sp.]|nr:ArsA-related P-loop ATPase [Enhygromyxa sp.]
MTQRPAQSVTNSLLDRRLLLFTGKGGVGKTTIVAALAPTLPSDVALDRMGAGRSPARRSQR